MTSKTPNTGLLKFEIRNRWTGDIQFVAEIAADDTSPYGFKVALAVKWALGNSANLSDADLRGANLSDANLSGADLSDANLSGADLSDANLSDANLSGAKNADLAIAKTRILPEGDLIGWKKCRHGVIVKLRIPEAAKRSHAFGRKCRAEYADVLEVIGADMGISLHDGKTEYVAGQRMTPDRFDENWMEECSSGIHFFISRLEAENYS